MVDLFQGSVLLAVTLIIVAVKGFALVNALIWSAEAYAAAGKLTKPGWLAILGIGFAAEVVFLGLSGGTPNPINIVNLIFTVAALVYVVDVRPALRQISGR